MTNTRADDATSLILYYVDKEYQETHPDFRRKVKKNAWKKAFRMAEENGILYHFLNRLRDEGIKNELLVPLLRKEEERLILFKNTLSVLYRIFRDNKIEFIFIKLYRGLPYIPRDVDVLVKPEQASRIVHAFKDEQFEIITFDGVEAVCKKEGLLKVDLYESFSYLTIPFISNEVFWKDQRNVDVFGVKCPIPPKEVDTLSLIIHALLGHRYLSLLDFLYAKSVLNEGWVRNELFDEARKFGWGQAFLKTVSKIQDIYHSLYHGSETSESIDFPYFFSYEFIWRAFNGFVAIPLSTKIKFMFVASIFLDHVLYKYQSFRCFLPIEMPEEIKDYLFKFMYKVRHRTGDKKAFRI